MNILRLIPMLLLLSIFSFAKKPPLPKNLAERDSFGVEFNILRPFFMKGIDINSLSGGVNYFNDTRGIEIALPITYNRLLYNRGYRANDYDDTSLTLDLHFRKFFNKEANGFYLGGFGRYTYLKGKSKNLKIAKLHRFGLGTELGVRFRQRNSPLYYGISFGTGVYLDNNQDIFEHEENYIMSMDGRKYFWDIELFKLGYQF